LSVSLARMKVPGSKLESSRVCGRSGEGFGVAVSSPGRSPARRGAWRPQQTTCGSALPDQRVKHLKWGEGSNRKVFGPMTRTNQADCRCNSLAQAVRVRGRDSRREDLDGLLRDIRSPQPAGLHSPSATCQSARTLVWSPYWI
jgi:hypothetical protein